MIVLSTLYSWEEEEGGLENSEDARVVVREGKIYNRKFRPDLPIRQPRYRSTKREWTKEPQTLEYQAKLLGQVKLNQ